MADGPKVFPSFLGIWTSPWPYSYADCLPDIMKTINYTCFTCVSVHTPGMVLSKYQLLASSLGKFHKCHLKKKKKIHQDYFTSRPCFISKLSFLHLESSKFSPHTEHFHNCLSFCVCHFDTRWVVVVCMVEQTTFPRKQVGRFCDACCSVDQSSASWARLLDKWSPDFDVCF